MKAILLFALIAIVLALGIQLLKAWSKARIERGPWPYYAKRAMTNPEQVLYHRLVGALPDKIILAQVQVSQVLGVKKGVKFYEWHNRINRLSYDFLICERDSSVIAAVELDDKTHEQEARIKTDAKKDKATKDAGIPMIRWSVKAMPSHAEIQAAIIKKEPTCAAPLLS